MAEIGRASDRVENISQSPLASATSLGSQQHDNLFCFVFF